MALRTTKLSENLGQEERMTQRSTVALEDLNSIWNPVYSTTNALLWSDLRHLRWIFTICLLFHISTSDSVPKKSWASENGFLLLNKQPPLVIEIVPLHACMLLQCATSSLDLILAISSTLYISRKSIRKNSFLSV